MKLPSNLAGLAVGVALLAALVGTPSLLTSQPAGPGAAQPQYAVALATQGADDAAGDGAQADPSAAVLPLSMRPFYHVFAAFGLTWLLIFGYAVSLRRRIATLEREVELLDR